MSTDHLLLLAADLVDDLESSRVANENRVRSLAEYGLVGTPEYDAVTAVVTGLADLEKTAVLNLRRVLRQHPLHNWVARTVGVGEKQGARLLAAIGDPYWNTLHDRPRTVSELWAYCGYHTLPLGHATTDAHLRGAQGAQTSLGQRVNDAHQTPAEGTSSVGQLARDTQRTVTDGTNSRIDQTSTETPGQPVDAGQIEIRVAAQRRRGERANWSSTAKMRAHLVAEKCVQNTGGVRGRITTRRSPYRDVYDARRAVTAERTHATPCVRCGPAGKPAAFGTPWNAGHQHADALRIVAKAILRDLWLEARALRDEQEQAA